MKKHNVDNLSMIEVDFFMGKSILTGSRLLVLPPQADPFKDGFDSIENDFFKKGQKKDAL